MKSMAHYITGLLLASPALMLVACQPKPATVMPFPTASSTIESISTASPVPTAVPSYQLLWSYQTDRAIWGPPAVDNGTVCFGSDDGNLYAVDRQTGSLEWKFATQGLVRSRPAIDHGMIYFTSDDGYLYVVDANGQQIWRTDIGNVSKSEKRENPGTAPDPTAFDYLQSSAVVFEDQVYVGSSDGNIYALATDTGQIVWTFKTGQKVRATPAVAEGTVYVGSWDGTVYALDALTGQTRWQTPIGGQIQTSALVANGLVYTASRKASVVALDTQTGQKKWEYDYGHNQWVESSPQLVGNLIYIGSSGNQMILGLDRETGEILTAFQGTVFFWSTPEIAENMLYIGAEVYTETSEVGGLFAFEISNDVTFKNRIPIKLKWVFPLTDTLMPDGNWAGVASSPVITDGVVYFGGLDGKLYAVALNP